MTELIPPDGWIGPGRPRLAAPAPAERGWLLGLISRVARRMGRDDVPDVIAVLHLNPRLFWPWLFFASRMMPNGQLPSRLRELVILRTAWLCRSRYEWGQHVDIGLRVGLTDEQVLAVTRGPEAFVGTPEHAALLACDQMVAQRFIEDATWQALVKQLGKKQVIELMLLAGHYVMIAGFLNSSGLVLEPPIEAKLQAFHARIAARA